MRRFARRLRERDGQAMLLTVVFLGVLLGASAITLDVGVWYREQRQAQATADAAALAGAQALPGNTTGAAALVQQYASANGGGVAAADVTFRSDWSTNDTVVVAAKRTAPSFFTKLFSIASVGVHASAAARAGVPEQVWGAAPIVVNKLHPLLSGPGCPCFGAETTLPLGKDGAPGAFGLVDLNGGSNGMPELRDWLASGYDGWLSLGDYESDPGAKFNDIEDALAGRVGTELLFPVYDTLGGSGANAEYDVIGWVGFHLDSSDPGHGSTGAISGWFTRVIWKGLQSKTNKHLPDFGVYSVSLVN